MGSVGRIFKDDFENGYTPWSGTYVDSGATLEVSSARAIKGVYSSKSVCGYGHPNAYVYKTFTPIDVVHARAYVYVESISPVIAYATLLSLSSYWWNLAAIGFGYSAGVRYIGTMWRDAEGLHGVLSPDVYPVGSWHCLEVMCKYDAVNGEIRSWFDGKELTHQTGLDTTSPAQVDRVWAGPSYNYFESGGELTVYVDLVELADRYIGLFKPLTLKMNPHAAL